VSWLHGYRSYGEPCMCGASDCRACRGPDAGRAECPECDAVLDDDGECEACAEKEERAECELDLTSAGYEFDDGEWSKLVATERHTARRDHKDGRVKKGQAYTVTTWRVVNDSDRTSYHKHVKWLVRS